MIASRNVTLDDSPHSRSGNASFEPSRRNVWWRQHVATSSDGEARSVHCPPARTATSASRAGFVGRDMGNRLYVGNLSFHTTADALRESFAEFGEVTDVHVVTDRESGQSRGFAFVTMGTTQAAAAAIAKMNGAQLEGRALRVNEAEERSQRGGGGGGGGGGRGGGGGGGWGGGGGGGGGRGGGKDRRNRW